MQIVDLKEIFNLLICSDSTINQLLFASRILGLAIQKFSKVNNKNCNYSEIFRPLKSDAKTSKTEWLAVR